MIHKLAEMNDDQEELSDHDDETWGTANMPALADVMTKVLRKRIKEDQGPILSKKKAKKELDCEATDEVIKATKNKVKQRVGYMKPNRKNMDTERKLSKIATQGVVQLFNAVKKHQQSVTAKVKKAGTLESKKVKALTSVDKGSFLNMLSNNKSANEKSAKTVMKNVDKDEENTWDVLRDNYMMGSAMKDWDCKNDSDSVAENGLDIDSDSDT